MRFALSVALATLASLTTLTACSRVGCKREVPPPPRDEVFTALEHFRDPIVQAAAQSEASRLALSRRIAEVSATHDASFAATGDVYVHHVPPAPDYACIAARTCFSDYVRFLADEERRAFPPGDVSQTAAGLAKELSLSVLEADVARRVAYVESQLPNVEGITFRGDPRAEQVVLLLSTGHAVEAKREASITRLLASHRVRVGEIRRERAPALFNALGKRLTAVALVNGHLRKDVIEYEQWLELLFPGEAFPPSVHRFADLTIFDAHEHVLAGGAGRLLEIARAEHLTGAIVAALPTPKDFAAPNEVVLAAARTEPPFLRPLVTLDEQAPDAPATMRALLGRGARGLKLLTG